MKKIILAAFCSILLGAFNAHAQNGWLPPVHFPAGSQLCDPEPYKLVFYDDFDGNSLSNQWHTYLAWDNMPPEENDNTAGARVPDDHNSLFKDENVLVNNGICRIIIKNEPCTWQCDTCSVSVNRSFTTGTIVTPFHINGQAQGQGNYYNSGAFEARIKFPTFRGAWCAFWLWNGAGVNEIDIAESHGDNTNGPVVFATTSNLPHVNYSLHAWAPNPNTYNVPNNVERRSHYPGQRWWDFIRHKNFKIQDWHVYKCEWDTSAIRFYVDWQLVSTQWKYSRVAQYGQYIYLVGSGCNPDGTWAVTYGYPYNNSSESQIRLVAKVDKDYRQGDPNNVFTLGEMDIDYVKAWQRHPEQDGHTDLCHIDQEPIISGPDKMCGSADYSATPAIPGGTWSTLGSANVAYHWTSGNTSYATIQHYGTNTGGTVYYNYSSGHEGCPVLSKHKNFTCYLAPGEDYHMAPGYDNTILLLNKDRTQSAKAQLMFFEPAPPLLPKLPYRYQWDIAYSIGSNDSAKAVHEQLIGQFASGSIFEPAENGEYSVWWTLKLLDSTGAMVAMKSGERDQNTLYGRQKDDTTLYYLDAVITDSAAYAQAVYEHVAQTFLPMGADTPTIQTMIERVKAEELAPYIIWPDTMGTMSYRIPDVHATRVKGDTRIYPNPAGETLYILPGKNFKSKMPVQIRIYDLPGRLQKSIEKPYFAGGRLSVPLSGLSNGTYMLQLQQGAYSEHRKIIKSDK